MLKKFHPARTASATCVILFACLTSLFIFEWTAFGCPGIGNYQFCPFFSPKDFYNSSLVVSSEDDFERLMDLRNFTFLMNNFECNTPDLALIILISSDPKNKEKRQTIRTTWGKAVGQELRLAFLLGVPNSTFAQEILIQENALYGDLVQGNFFDTYRNLSYKHVMALKWVKYFCKNAKYVLKMDDDVFVNSPNLLQYVNGKHYPLPKTGLIRCHPQYEGRVKRSYRSKWRVTLSEFRYRQYPPYCNGFAILYSRDVADTLYAMAQTARYFWIDDVFVTGILTSSSNYTITTFGSDLLLRENLPDVLSNDSGLFSYLLGPCNLGSDDIRKLWEKALRVL